MPTEPTEGGGDWAWIDPVERQIRESMARGEFDNLPGSGRPIPDLDGGYDPAWWAKRWLERARLEDAIHEVRRVVDRELPFLRVHPDREKARRRILEINEMITAVNERVADHERVPPIEP